MQSTERIFGRDIFFNFTEVPFEHIEEASHYVKQIRNNELHGFIVKNVLTPEEVEQVLKAIEKPVQQEGMDTPSGKIFPAPFAIISDSNEKVNTYFDFLNRAYELAEHEPALKTVYQKLDKVFKAVARDYKVSIPINKIKNQAVSPGQFRVFDPGKGGLYVHCGNLFQSRSLHYYSLLANDIDMNDQLSFFLLLQNSEQGGELTIYNMLWKDVKRKSSVTENDSVIDDNGNTIMLKDLESFAVRPLPGDILIFSGGPIWHRVENIQGSKPRITFGGFLNYSKDDKELFYWS